jgi:chemotaxis protein CheC
MSIDLTEDQYEMLKEVVNLAMGQAGSDLASILNSFVDLSVPDIQIVKAEKLAEKVLQESVFGETEKVTLLRQTFYNAAFMEGEAIVIFNDETRQRFSEILGISNQMNLVEEMDFMLELSNLMVGACLNSISTQLFNKGMTFSPPELLSEHKELRIVAYETFKRRNLKWDYTLLSKITFNLREKSFKSDLLIFISEAAIKAINKSLDKLLSEL